MNKDSKFLGFVGESQIEVLESNGTNVAGDVDVVEAVEKDKIPNTQENDSRENSNNLIFDKTSIAHPELLVNQKSSELVVSDSEESDNTNFQKIYDNSPVEIKGIDVSLGILENTADATKCSLSQEVQNNSQKIDESCDLIKSDLNNESQNEMLRRTYNQEITKLKAALFQKDNVIALYQRENAILEKEKQAFRQESETAIKEKESTVIKYAMQEKLLIDVKKDKEKVEKQLGNANLDIKHKIIRYQAAMAEKERIACLFDEKCNEMRRYQRECEKLKAEVNHLDSKIKYYADKLKLEVESKNSLEKKLEEYKAPKVLEHQKNEKLKVECDAHAILLKHELENAKIQLEESRKDLNKSNKLIQELQERLEKTSTQYKFYSAKYDILRLEYSSLQHLHSEEMLNLEKLRKQHENLQGLEAKNALYKDKLENLEQKIQELEEHISDKTKDILHLRTRETELLSVIKEMSESVVCHKNEVCLLQTKCKAMISETEVLKESNKVNEENIISLENLIQKLMFQRNEERVMLAKLLCEKTKLYEIMKLNLHQMVGDFEAYQNKQSAIIKKLNREVKKYKVRSEQNNNFDFSGPQKCMCYFKDFSKSENLDTTTSGTENFGLQAPVLSKNLLVERILRLQKALARQTEKIDLLENHALLLVSELQKKSKLVQYYMLRDQTGILTSPKCDQSKSEIIKYGNGIMSSIYGGNRSEIEKSMTLELSLEINKKLQSVLEDTLLKNITLKENIEALGVEIDNLNCKLTQVDQDLTTFQEKKNDWSNTS